jgi:SAM-dependent methyltransferase
MTVDGGARYVASTYGDTIADIYDELYTFPSQTAAAVELLAELAGDGRVLELGIGTGRLALPLARRGLAVSGIDASEAMLAKLRAKPGADAVDVVVGDFADVPGSTTCSLVYVAFNTFFALTTQEDQVRCFANVARRLAPDGRFVIEAFVPDVTRFDRHQRTSASTVRGDLVMLEVSEHDPVDQHVVSAHVVLTEEGTRIYPVQIRYSWPGELDLMARLAGLSLEQRWGDWERSPFTATSTGHVSVWRPL